jgi:hypothetical protein
VIAEATKTIGIDATAHPMTTIMAAQADDVHAHSHAVVGTAMSLHRCVALDLLDREGCMKTAGRFELTAR